MKSARVLRCMAALCLLVTLGSAALRADVHAFAEDSGAEPESADVPMEERISSIKNATKFVSNVIVGTPIREIPNKSDLLHPEEEAVLPVTDYEFSVRDYVFGASGEKTIVVCSQVGDAFEIGKEYTFAASHIDSVYYDTYNVVSHSWIVDNGEIAGSELESLLSAVGRDQVPRVFKSNVIEKAALSESFADHVDVAVVATVTDIDDRSFDLGVFSAIIDVREIVKGTPIKEAFEYCMRLKGEVSAGKTYLMLFEADEDGNLSLAAREGCIIPDDDPQYAAFIDLLSTAGWKTADGQWYYLIDGEKVKADTNIDGVRYTIDSTGMCTGRYTGWTHDSRNRYYYVDGVRQTGWTKADGKTYCFDWKGRMRTGWLYESIMKAYYLGEDGVWDGTTGTGVDHLPETLGDLLVLRHFSEDGKYEARVGTRVKFEEFAGSAELRKILYAHEDVPLAHGVYDYDVTYPPESIYTGNDDLHIRRVDQDVDAGFFVSISRDPKDGRCYMSFRDNCGIELNDNTVYDRLKKMIVYSNADGEK